MGWDALALGAEALIGQGLVLLQGRKIRDRAELNGEGTLFIADQVRPKNGKPTGEIIETISESVSATQDAVEGLGIVLGEHLEQARKDRALLNLPPIKGES